MAHVSTSFPFMVGQHFIAQVYRTLFIHSPAHLVLHMILHSVPGIPEVHSRGPGVGWAEFSVPQKKSWGI